MTIGLPSSPSPPVEECRGTIIFSDNIGRAMPAQYYQMVSLYKRLGFFNVSFTMNDGGGAAKMRAATTTWQ